MSFLAGILTVVLIANCVVLAFLVLIQLPKKDAGAGVAFGGGAADALFGAGSGNTLTKITKWATICFLCWRSSSTLPKTACIATTPLNLKRLFNRSNCRWRRLLSPQAHRSRPDTNSCAGINQSACNAALVSANQRPGCHKQSDCRAATIQVGSMDFFKRAPGIFSGARFIFCLAAILLFTGCIRREQPADVIVINNAEPETLRPGLADRPA